MINGQLELSLANHPSLERPRFRSSRPRLTSRMWFQRMRQIVDCALDWQPTPPPRPEQIWFPGTHRQVHLNP